MDSVADFPALFPNLSSLELMGDYISGFSNSMGSRALSISQLCNLFLADAPTHDIANLLTCLRRPKCFKCLHIYRPFYEEEHFNVLVEAVSSFFSSNPNPVQFHDLTCFANDESTSSMRENLFMDFVLRTSTNSTTKGDVTFILQLMSMEDFPIDSEEAIFTFLDCLTLEKIEKLTLEGYDIQLPSQLWKFNETLQTLVLDNIERSFLDWASLPPTSKNHPNFSTLVIRNEQSSADFPLDLVINLLSFCNRETGTPLPLLIVEGKYLPAFKPSVLLHLGVIERVEYKNGLEAGLTNEEDSVETVSFEEEDTDESE